MVNGQIGEDWYRSKKKDLKIGIGKIKAKFIVFH